MKNKRNDIHKSALNDIFSVTSEVFQPVTEETEQEIMKEIEKEQEIVQEYEKEGNGTIEKIKETKKSDTSRKTFNIPNDIVRDMEKIVYMDRDIKDNTDLLIKALRYYLSTKSCQDLLKEYNSLKKVEK